MIPPMQMELSLEKVKKYMRTTGIALELVRIAKGKEKDAASVLDMASRYHSDAKFYLEKGDLVTAFAALNYAHGWIDCGVRLGALISDPEDHEFIMPA
jgi:uncharacterized protein